MAEIIQVGFFLPTQTLNYINVNTEFVNKSETNLSIPTVQQPEP